MPRKDKQSSFEDKLRELEEITRKLDDPSSSLESSLELFEKGVKLGRELHAELESAKLKVQKLMENGRLEPLEQPGRDEEGGRRDG